MIKVSDNLYRGERPVDFKTLKEAGIKTVINLQSGVYEERHDDTYEKQFGPDFGIYEHNIALSDITAPKKWQVDKILRILVDQRNGPVYIHCLHGKDRTGFVCAVYRMQVQGWTYEKAKQEMFELGFHKFPYLFWLSALKKWASK